jgi:hypothetical protein
VSARLSPSAPWNRPYKKRTVCVPLAPGLDSGPPVLYPDGREVGPGYDAPLDPQWNKSSTEGDLCVGKPGHVRIDLTESVPNASGGPDLYFHKGGQGYKPADEACYGHVTADAFDDAPEPVFTRERIDEDGADPGHHPLPGAGRAHPRDLEAYFVRPLAISSEADASWLYKKGRAGSRYSKYGDAGVVQGARDQHFAYLSWSWLRQDGDDGETVPGGGAVRALLADGQLVHRCAVESITTPAWDLEGDLVGRVVAIYVRVPAGVGVDLYGWIVHSHLVPDDSGRFQRVMHLERAD